MESDPAWFHPEPSRPGPHLSFLTHRLQIGSTLPRDPPGSHVFLPLPWFIVLLALTQTSGSTTVHTSRGSASVFRAPVSNFLQRTFGSALALLSYGVTPGLCLLCSTWVSPTYSSTSVRRPPGSIMAPSSIVSTIALCPNASALGCFLAHPSIISSLAPSSKMYSLAPPSSVSCLVLPPASPPINLVSVFPSPST